jgi:peptidoglycan/LPS O-acetylase OafA/YrhL
MLTSITQPKFGHRIFHSGILQYFGRKSYGLYLWHLLIFNVFSRHVHFGPGFVRIAIAVAVSLALTEASWRLIESPVLALKNRHF